MNRVAKTSFWTIVFGLIFLIAVGPVSAQKVSIGPVGPLWEDTAINPHEFTNEYYEANGIIGKVIMNRRTGSDGLSTFGNSSNPFHSDIRVTATIPAYDEFGGILFWYPLGEIADNAFTWDKMGWQARELANRFPIYVFPHRQIQDLRLVYNARQAPLMDNSWSMIMGPDMTQNPLGLREVFFVSFTDKAFTKEGAEMMAYMVGKNGMGADDTPILRSMDDLRMMIKHELVIASTSLVEDPPIYALAPMISDPTNGVIAPDAFLLFATKDGTPLPSESMFSVQFGCLQKTGSWCKE